MNPWVLVSVAYLVGATPTSFWLGKLRGVDLRNEGSGNLGATNAYRVLGWGAGIPVVVVDVFKGWFPVWYFPRLMNEGPWAWVLAFGAAAIVGHVFSFWVGFRGGKGVATSAGVLIGLAPMAALAGFIVWTVAVWVTRRVSVGSIAAAIALPLAIAGSPGEGGDALLGFTVALAIFVIWAHRTNIGRLMRGQEPRIGEKKVEA